MRRGSRRTPGWTPAADSSGLDLALATAVTGHALQGQLTADGPVVATVTYARWRRGSRAALAAQLGLEQLPPALEVTLGGAVALEAGTVFVLPAGRVTFAPAAEWSMEAAYVPLSDSRPG